MHLYYCTVTLLKENGEYYERSNMPFFHSHSTDESIANCVLHMFRQDRKKKMLSLLAIKPEYLTCHLNYFDVCSIFPKNQNEKKLINLVPYPCRERIMLNAML